MIELRRVTADDWPAWRDLRLAALGESPEMFRSTLADWRDADEARWRKRLTDVTLTLIADLAGKPAGTIGGNVEDAGTVLLMSLWVAPFARGRGVGDALVDAILDWARDGGAHRVRLGVLVHNRAAADLYLRHGFTDVGLIPGRSDERQMTRPV